MRKAIVAATLLAAFASPALAVSFTATPGAPDPGPLPGQYLVVTFDAPNAPGYNWSGSLLTAIGTVPSVHAAPAGNATIYGYVTGSPAAPGVATLSTPSLKSISFYWGSIDLYNKVEVLGPGGAVLHTVMGGDFSPANGSQIAPGTNMRVSFDAGAGQTIRGLRLTATGVAFEFDDFAATAVPEPATWAMLIAGFGLVGFAMRRRRGFATASA